MSAGHVGVIAGSGFVGLGIETADRETVTTPYGEPSSPLLRMRVGGRTLWCIARHGLEHTIAPHAVNYRANIWALRARGVETCLGLNWVGGIAAGLEPGELAVPEQIIDYTHGRETTLGVVGEPVTHIDFTEPFDSRVGIALVAAARRCGLVVHGGTYGVTQGPRLETAAEIDRLERDGCTIVGMTAMPEAALAREAGLAYAILAAVVNRAAGRAARGLHEQMQAVAARVTAAQLRVLEEFLRRLPA